VNALVAPVVNYGVTGSLDAFPGAFTIPEDAYRAFSAASSTASRVQGFKKHHHRQRPRRTQTAILNDLAEKRRPRTSRSNAGHQLVAIAPNVTLKVFGEDGGHAGWNENAFIQAIDPKLVHPDRYSDALATPRPPGGTWSAYPFPSSIILYQPNQGYVKFDQAKADQ